MECVPSDVVAYIETYFPDTKIICKNTHATTLSTLLEIIDRIPQNLIRFYGEDRISFLICIERIRVVLALWARGSHSHSVSTIPPKKQYIIDQLLNLFGRLPDETTTQKNEKLAFITDNELRKSILLDLDTAESSINNNKFKSGTVFSGVVIEAILLYDLQKVPEETLKKNYEDKFKKKSLLQLDLNDYIEMSIGEDRISDESKELAIMAKNFRNLIHPGREKRLEQRCTKSTALASLAAAERIIEDLEI